MDFPVKKTFKVFNINIITSINNHLKEKISFCIWNSIYLDPTPSLFFKHFWLWFWYNQKYVWEYHTISDSFWNEYFIESVFKSILKLLDIASKRAILIIWWWLISKKANMNIPNNYMKNVSCHNIFWYLVIESWILK